MAVELLGMTCGWLTMDYGFFLKGEEGKLAVPVPSYIVKHPKGVVVFDTGLEKALQSDDPMEVDSILGPLASEIHVDYRQGEDISARLAAAEIEADAVDIIVNSHLHYDHCGGNTLLANAHMIVQKREWDQAHTDECLASGAYCTAHFDAGHDCHFIDGEHDVFGDGSVVILPSHGHTAGHQSLKISLEGGEVILAGDACYLRKSLEQMRLPIDLVVNDRAAMLATFEAFKRLQAAGAKILFGHDPDQWSKLNTGPIRPISISDIAAAERAR